MRRLHCFFKRVRRHRRLTFSGVEPKHAASANPWRPLVFPSNKRVSPRRFKKPLCIQLSVLLWLLTKSVSFLLFHVRFQPRISLTRAALHQFKDTLWAAEQTLHPQITLWNYKHLSKLSSFCTISRLRSTVVIGVWISATQVRYISSL